MNFLKFDSKEIVYKLIVHVFLTGNFSFIFKQEILKHLIFVLDFSPSTLERTSVKRSAFRLLRPVPVCLST